MGKIRTELELRFIADLSQPLTPAEHDLAEQALGLARRLRQLKQGPAAATGDLDALQERLHEMKPPVAFPLPGTRLTPLEQAERATIEQALADASGVRTIAARTIGMSVRTLRYKITQYRIDAPYHPALGRLRKHFQPVASPRSA